MVATDLKKYWQSITQELDAVKNRVRYLIGDRHWPTEGGYKEVALRNVIRRHLPDNFQVCSGFVVAENNVSSQIDLLIIDNLAFTLFKEGDLVIVTPSAVSGIVEVKTACAGRSEIDRSLIKLAENAKLCEQTPVERNFWAGLFVFEGRRGQYAPLLQGLSTAFSETGYRLDCVAYGPNNFVRFWPNYEDKGSSWVCYELSKLAAGYFIGNMIVALASRLSFEGAKALFPEEGGKQSKRICYLKQGETEVTYF